MGKLTYIIVNQRTQSRAHVIVDGTDVHASHPKGEHRLVTFKTDNDKAALAKFQEVIKQHFHPRDGWILDEKKPGVAEYPEFPKPLSAEELAAQQMAQQLRRLGYVQDGDTMVIDLKKQRTVSDLEIALDHARDVQHLWVITTSYSDGAGVQALFKRLHAAVPKLRSLFLDCPWETLTRASSTPLKDVGAFLEQHKTLVRLGLTGEVRLAKPIAQDALTTLSVCSNQLDATTVAQLAARKTPKLKQLHVCLAVEGAVDGDAVAAVPSLLPKSVMAPKLDVFTVAGLPDVTDMITTLSGVASLPLNVRLDGSCGDGDALVAAVTKWVDKHGVPDSAGEIPSKLELGVNVRGALDDDVLQAIDAKIGDAPFASPFAPEAHDAKARALWSILA